VWFNLTPGVWVLFFYFYVSLRASHCTQSEEGSISPVFGPLRPSTNCEKLSVLDYTIGNDVSQRTWQIQDGSLWRAKNSDTFKPMGPWIATELDPNNLETTIRINGQVSAFYISLSSMDGSIRIDGIEEFVPPLVALPDGLHARLAIPRPG